MSGQTRYTVLPADGFNTQSEYDQYVELMKERNLPFAPDRRVTQTDGSVRLEKDATCIWDGEDEAENFADELGRRTGTSWVVREYASEEV